MSQAPPGTNDDLALGPDALLSAMARGDHQAFACFYHSYADEVLGLALRQLRDRTQAEQLTKDVFLELWARAARYDPSRGTVEAWLFTVAHRRAAGQLLDNEKGPGRNDVTRSDLDLRPVGLTGFEPATP